MTITTLPRTARDWQLYCSKTGSDKAARALTDALGVIVEETSERRREGYVPTRPTITILIHKHLYPVMEKYAEFGACDTEPRTVAYEAVEKALGLTRGSW